MAGSLRQRLLEGTPPPGGRESLTALLGGLMPSSALQALVAELVVNPKTHLETRNAALGAMAQHAPKNPPESWSRALVSALDPSSDAAPVAETRNGETLFRAARPLAGQPALREALLRTARTARLPTLARMQRWRV